MVLASEPGPTFTIGLILIRIALLCMNASVYMSLPQGRGKARMDMTLDFIVTLMFVIAFFVEYHSLARLPWFEGWRVAMNIDHYAEREGCLVMAAKRTSSNKILHRYALVSAIDIFFGNFYFAAKPPRDMQALRRSVYTVAFFTILHYLLLPTLLSIGVGTKLVSEAVLHHQSLSPTELWILFGSISLALLEMVLICAMHHWRRQPVPSDHYAVKRIKYIWWGICALIPLLPLVAAGILQTINDVDPIIALVVAKVMTILWLVSETAVIHQLQLLHLLGNESLNYSTNIT
ncbi:hypothetical protein THRCLA_20349 [Thraustotheca clavata]|uniref:Transmembrane protein n=1 Tax=Thraustotheca clavata TaxID=74557 RepID=A0A1W0A8P0_9STRA|nr:hypothetical protein THRCLA_20349 [Thraustotheca clavata]